MDTTQSSTENEPITLEELKLKLSKVFATNNYKRGTKAAKTCEYSFLQGAMSADPRLAQNHYLIICLVTGRSILDK